MKISGKVVFFVLLAFTAALGLLALSLNTLIDKNRERIQQEIQKALRRPLTFDELRLSLWGGPGLSAKNVRLAEDPRFAATPFLRAKELRMQLQWSQLLLGKLAIKNFILQEPEVQIIKNEAGEWNILAMAAPEKEPRGPAEAKEPKEAAEAKGRAAPTLALSAVHISQGKIDYIDRSTKTPVEIRIRNVDLDVGGLALQRSLRLNLAANVIEGQGQNINVQGRVGPLKANKDWTQQPLDLQFQIDPLPLTQLGRALPLLREQVAPQLGIVGPVAIEAKVAGTAERPRISDLVLTGALFGSIEKNATVSGEMDFSKGASWRDGEVKAKIVLDPVSLERLGKSPLLKPSFPAALKSEGPLSVTADIQGRWEDSKAQVLIKAEQSEIRYGDWLKKDKGVPAEIELKIRRRKDRLLFEDSTLALDNLKTSFSGSLQGSPERRLLLSLRSDGSDLSGWDRFLPALSSYSVGGRLRWNLTIRKSLDPKGAVLDIRGDLNLDGVQATDKKSGRSVDKASARISFRGKEARIENGSVRIGASHLALSGAIASLSRPVLRYSLRSAKLDLADLLGPSAYKSDQLRNLQSAGELQMGPEETALRGNLSSAEGTFQEIPYRNLKANVTWSPKEMGFQNLTLQALGGTLRVSGAWERGKGTPQRLAINPTIESVDLKPLMAKKFPNFRDHLEGHLDFKAKLRAESREGSALQEGLEGEGEAFIRKGALRDFNLVQQVLSRVIGLPGISNLISSRVASRYPFLKRRDTPFDTLEAFFNIGKGQIHTRRLFLSTPDYSIEGKGSTGFDKTIKWKASLIMSSQFTQDLIQEHKNVRYMVDRQGRLAIPFGLEGTLPSVQPRPDLGNLAEAIQRGLLRAGMERGLGGRESKKGGGRNQIRKGLEQLFGR